MAVTDTPGHSRRAIIAGFLGAAAASVAAALGRPDIAAAADNEAMLVGGEYTSTSVTNLTNTTNGATVFSAASTLSVGIIGSSGASTGVIGSSSGSAGVQGICANGTGVHGTSVGGTGVRGDASSGVGVVANSSTGRAVEAYSTSDVAVFAENSAPDQPACYGWATGLSSGVMGVSSGGARPAPSPKTGVYGYAVQDANAKGVYGRSSVGTGVYGWATTGTAGYFSTPKPPDSVHTGIALRAVGRVKLDRCAGVTTIPNGLSSTTVSPGIDLVSSSAVVATLMGDAGGATTVKRATANSSTNQITITLTAPVATAGVKVAWHVFG